MPEYTLRSLNDYAKHRDPEVIRGHGIEFVCLKCGQAARPFLRPLISRLGGQSEPAEFMSRMRCQKCQHLGATYRTVILTGEKRPIQWFGGGYEDMDL